MDRQQAHQLLDQLGPAQFDAVVRLLEVILSDDDEEPTAEDRRALAASREYFRQNPEGGIPFEQVVAECGFTMDQVRRHQGE
jgi:nitrate reductase beta subunit